MNVIYECLIACFLVIVVNKLNKYIFKGILKRRNKIHLKFLRSIISVLIYAIGIYFIFSQFETTKNITKSIMTSSSIIVAVTIFTAQESLNDIISGVMMSWSKPFEIGERVQIIGLGITGIIEDITVRHTIIRTFNHSKIVVPNSVLNKQVLEKNSNSDSRVGNFLDVTISYESNLDKAISLLEKLVSSHELVIITEETPVKVVIRDLTENGIALRVQVWTTEVGDNFKACSDLRKSLLETFKENNIEIPYKQIKVIRDTSELIVTKSDSDNDKITNNFKTNNDKTNNDITNGEELNNEELNGEELNGDESNGDESNGDKSNSDKSNGNKTDNDKA